MLPGPTLILACSACSARLLRPTLLSGNTFGAQFWTDGFREAPMLPDQPALVKCPQCGAMLWLKDLRELGEVSEHISLVEAPLANGANDFQLPTVADYVALLAGAALVPEREHHVRFRLWWEGNHVRRPGRRNADQTQAGMTTLPPLSKAEVENLEALAALLDERDIEGRIGKAECLRELGRFAEAAALLEGAPKGDVDWVVEQVLRLARAESRTVAKLTVPR